MCVSKEYDNITEKISEYCSIFPQLVQTSHVFLNRLFMEEVCIKISTRYD